MVSFKFKEGDIVEIINSGISYTTYKGMFKQMGFINKTKNDALPRGTLVQIFAKSVHEDNGKVLYGCVDKDRNEVLIGEEGIEFVTFKRNKARCTTINEYEVVITNEHIKVGCQTITLDKFKEIISLAKEVGLIS